MSRYRGWARVAMVGLIAVVLGGAVHAQKIDCRPKKECDQPVVFAPTEAAYVAAIGSALLPDSPQEPIGATLKRDKREAFSAEMWASPWEGPAALALEVRVTVSGRNVPTEVLGWMPLDQVPVTLLQSDEQRVEVAIEYRLVVDGSEPPGRYATSVTTRVWDALDNSQKHATVTHDISVTIPSYLLVRVAGSTGAPAVAFDLAADVAGYLQAVGSARALPPTGATFDAVEVATNNPSGFSLTVSVAPAALPAGVGPSAVELFGEPADGVEITRDHATPGYEAVVRPGDFALRVDGSEAAGVTQFQLTYAAQRLP